MARPTKAQKKVLDEKLVVIQDRINRAGRAKRGVNLGASRVQFHEILDRASHPIKRPQSDSEQP